MPSIVASKNERNPDKLLGNPLDGALNTISDGLVFLDNLDWDNLKGSRLVDVAARLHAQYKRLEKIYNPLKDRIKTNALTDNAGINSTEIIVKGETYQAVIHRVEKKVFDTAAAKRALGNRLPRYMVQRVDTVLDFDVKE